MDDRTRDEKLMAVAQQDGSPAERDAARVHLSRRGLWPPPASLDDRPTSSSMRTATVPTMPGCAGGVHYNRSSIGGRLDARGHRHLG